jgi:hypothetical protein
MAILKKGDLTFKLQPGARGPYPDSTYELYRREEEWVGQETDLTSFLATKAPNSAHPSFGYMKLYEYSVTLNEAGMASVSLTYTGHPNGIGSTNPTKRFQKMLKTATIEGVLKRTFKRWVYEDGTGSGTTSINQTTIDVTQKASAEINYRYYSPSITYRYSSSTIVTSPRYSAQAAIDLSGQTPTITLESAKKTSTYLHTDYPFGMPAAWLTNGDDLSDFSIQGSITNTTESKDGQQMLNNPVIRPADLVAEQRGSFWEVEETHEIELQ